ncbi:HIPL1 protein-like [Diospyros lotus]|uniref:HIPL1 protein-like n=1 Tax=Diospyros lotus TaxID=55363 RepID=UPI00225C38BE|nr:HIPL1 protein-like [Diospyros lotus]
MAAAAVTTLFLFFCSLLLPHSSSALPLCTDLRAPEIQKAALSFCPYSGRVCCDSAKDLELKKQFQAMNVSDSGCASVIKSILCATCDQFAEELFRVDTGPGPVPVLCKSNESANSPSSSHTESSFCSQVWDACQNTAILNSPFATSLQSRTGVLQNSTSTKLTELWQSKSEFCEAFGGASGNDSLCFNGKPVSLNDTETSVPPKGLCLEKIGEGQYLNMVAHPDGSNRAFFSSQAGKIWLATIPEQGSGGTLDLDESSPFVDLTDQVHLDTTFGVMGMAFHPNFAQNGRFFTSFNCDKVKSPTCSGRCSCNSDVNCDPSKLNSSKGAQPCQYHSVIAEYTASGTASEPAMAKTAKPTEVRRIFTMGLPFTNNHGGQILFGPKDGYLYFMMGDGGSKGDPYNFAQNKKSLLGKIMRLDVDNIPSAEEISNLGLWGNYSIPRDNPYHEDKELKPEIWALGLRNPWRCSFDSERPSYFLCADVGQDRYEEVDIITKGGNYGWSIYEGPLPFNNQHFPSNTSADSETLIFPVLGYNHSAVNSLGSAAISGGYFYNSKTDPCVHGSYLYGDLYGGAIWAAAETPRNSGNMTASSVPFSCASDSPIACHFVPGSRQPALEYIFSFGQDNRKDVFILASSGVYRIVRPSRCNYTCSKETVTTTDSPSSTPSSYGNNPVKPRKKLVFFLLSLMLLAGTML